MKTATRYQRMYSVLAVFVLAQGLIGLALCGPVEALEGLERIVLSEDALITDYVLVGGPGPALINSALVTLLSLFLLWANRVPCNGTTLVTTGLMMGFSLFGKNLINIWPILAGTWLYARWKREPLGLHISAGLMSTALAPIISYIFLDNGWGHPLLAVLIGLGIGFVMPPLSAYTYKVQNGMNLYNMGFACGVTAMILVPLLSSLGAEPETRYHWAEDCTLLFAPGLAILCVGLIVWGIFFAGKPWWASWAGYRVLLRTTGRAPSDYVRMFDLPPVLINMGVNGLIGMSFVLLGGGTLNGPTVGGVLTIMGFSAFGKHARNILPVMAGVFLGSLVMHWSLSDPAVQLACLFCTALAPVSGYFGWPFGVLAGFLHSSVVLYTGSPVAGMNLYNNGFSGGLVAMVLYPIIIAVVHDRKPELQNDDYLALTQEDTPTAPQVAGRFREQRDD